MKKSQKIHKNTSSCEECNGVKIFEIFIHLIYFGGIWILKKTGGPLRPNGPSPGLKKPLGTGPVTTVTGLTGPARFRIRAVLNRGKFKF